MAVAKKIIQILFAAIIFLCAFTKIASAQCDTFDSPFFQNGNILFYNCDFGEIQKFDIKNNVSQVSGTDQLGGFIHNFVWSPDGSTALVLAENITATVQDLEFYSPSRKSGSLNWWTYDFKTGKAVLLDEKIISIGWVSNTEVVYNWDNKNISTANFDNSSLNDNNKLADITNDSDDLNSIIPPVSMSDVAIFPMQKGFFAVTSGGKEAKYYPLPGGVQEVLSDPFEQKYFVILSGSSLYKFTVSNETLVVSDSRFSAEDLAFLNVDSLAIAGTDGRVYSYDINTKVKTLISLGVTANVSRVFSGTNKGEFLFIDKKNIYEKSLNNNSTTLLGQDWNTVEKPLNTTAPTQTKQPTSGSTDNNLTPAEQQQTSTAPSPKSNSTIIILVAVILFILGIIILLVFLQVRKKKQ